MTCTASTDGSETNSSTLSTTGGSGAVAAFARARSGEEPTIPTTSRPSRRNASVWATPMNPVPITPTPVIARPFPTSGR